MNVLVSPEAEIYANFKTKYENGANFVEFRCVRRRGLEVLVDFRQFPAYIPGGDRCQQQQDEQEQQEQGKQQQKQTS